LPKGRGFICKSFSCRLDDIGSDGMILIRDIADIFAVHEIDTEIIAASI
jgi:transaldolase